jgi:hypothetical protein
MFSKDYDCSYKSFLFLLIPLILSAFTHLWNPAGFPYFHGDEGHYMRRAMHVLEGLGPQEQRNTTWSFERPYDHPYFGQLFLATVLGTINYPGLVDPKIGDVNSIEMLHLIPRVLMGVLAVVDTFLIYKIAERRYSRNVAFVAAILFAVMPLSWLMRRVLLDSILLPFLLLSILFGIPFKYKDTKTYDNPNYKIGLEKNHGNKILLSISLSGIFLGIAIFTKISAFAMIPLVACLIYTQAGSDNTYYTRYKKLKILGLWFAPVILIPLIWPEYAISLGQFEEWLDGLSWQAGRSEISIWDSLIDILRIDPVLFLVGVAGFFYAGVVKRDVLIVLWIIPFLIFFNLVGHVRYYYWIPAIPVFCLAAAILITDLSNKISRKKVQKILPFAIISAIAIFGLAATFVLLTSNVNSMFFEVYAFITDRLPDLHKNSRSNNESVVVIGSNWMQTFSWIPKYVFDKDHDFKTFLRERHLPDKNEKVLLLVDYKDLERFVLSENNTKTFEKKQLYNSAHLVALFKEKSTYYVIDSYPHYWIHSHPDLSKGIEVRTNY